MAKSTYHVVHFNIKKSPDIMPWLSAQKSEPTSLAQLIRLAQVLGGNQDWMKVSPTIVGKVIKSIPRKTAETQAFYQASSPSPSSTIRHHHPRVRKTDLHHEDENRNRVNPSNSRDKLNFNKNGLKGF